MSIFSQRGATGPLAYAQTSLDANLATMVGSVFETSDGREFVLVQNAGTALAQGKTVQGPAAISNHQGLTTSTAAIGAMAVTVTAGGTLITANQYAGGYVIFSEGTGLGQTLKIKSHPAATSSGTCVLSLEDPIQVATDTASTKSFLVKNPFGSANGTDVRTEGVVICPTTLTGQVIGVSTTPIPASTATIPSYGFIQKKGMAAVLNRAATAIGLNVGTSSSTTAGACETYAAATNTLIGAAVTAGVDGKYGVVNLNI